jgi:hypothetical protein
MSKNTETQERRALSIKEAAQTCGLSRASGVYRLIADGKAEHVEDRCTAACSRWRDRRPSERGREMIANQSPAPPATTWR